MNRGIRNIVIGLLVTVAVAIAPAAGPLATPSAGAVAVSTAPSTSVVVSSSTLTLSVNAVLENAVVLLTNVKRLAVGCRPLRVNLDLRQAARGHSRKMARAGVMSHRLPGEARLGVRITRAGYTNWTRVAENIAAGFSSASTVIRAWWSSPSHRRNIADCSLRHIGVGVVFTGRRLYWTQDFGRR